MSEYQFDYEIIGGAGCLLKDITIRSGLFDVLNERIWSKDINNYAWNTRHCGYFLENDNANHALLELSGDLSLLVIAESQITTDLETLTQKLLLQYMDFVRCFIAALKDIFADATDEVYGELTKCENCVMEAFNYHLLKFAS